MKLLALVGLLAVTGLVLAACGDDNDSTDGAVAAQLSTVGASERPLRVGLSGNEALGDFLVASNGHTLYVFAQDEGRVSTCSGGCLDSWPPLIIPEGARPTADERIGGTLAAIERDDGIHQVTYEGAPLYFFAGDSAPGQTNGHEVGGVWFVAAEDHTPEFEPSLRE